MQAGGSQNNDPRNLFILDLLNIIHPIHYRLYARHRKGYGVHSPFVYQLITGIIEEKYPYYCYEELEEKRWELSPRERRRCLAPHDAQLLFRLLNSFDYYTVMEWGEGDPITRLYLQSVSRRVEFYPGGSRKSIAPDLLLCYAGADDEALSSALDEALSLKKEHSLLVLSGLHRSGKVCSCWEKLLAHSDVSLSLEMSGLGLVFFRPELQKRNYILRH